jgi:hypothetical protein
MVQKGIENKQVKLKKLEARVLEKTKWQKKKAL